MVARFFFCEPYQSWMFCQIGQSSMVTGLYQRCFYRIAWSSSVLEKFQWTFLGLVETVPKYLFEGFGNDIMWGLTHTRIFNPSHTQFGYHIDAEGRSTYNFMFEHFQYLIFAGWSGQFPMRKLLDDILLFFLMAEIHRGRDNKPSK